MTKKKNGYWYILNIFYFLIVTTGNVALFDKFFPIINRNYYLFFLYQLVLFYALILFFSLFLFKVSYGPFGRYKRASFPKDKIIEKFISSGRVGIFPIDNPIIRAEFTVFKNGLGIKILRLIKIYIPKENFKTFEGRRLLHDSPETYNPIIANEKIIMKLNEIVANS
ncbi:MAG: hypothetical protein JXC36_05885 [Candidatus Atribacteria bacterium]|nr:hypothetical protein [Candidatus Atribacteria bacterium]